MQKNISCESVQDLEVISDEQPEVNDEYFKSQEQEFEMVDKSIPITDFTQTSMLNSFYNTLSHASTMPEFSESAKGILDFFTQGVVTRATYENILIATATAISFNPAFAWWLMFNGGIMTGNFLLVVAEFSVMNPTKVVALYGLSRKLPAIMKLFSLCRSSI